MSYSANIHSVLQGLQNEAPVYLGQLKAPFSSATSSLLNNLSLAMTALGQSAVAAEVNTFANGNPNENIVKWGDLKPVLAGSPAHDYAQDGQGQVEIDTPAIVGVSKGLANAGANVTALNALLQNIPGNASDQVYCDQFKLVFNEIVALLAGLGQ